MKFGRRFKIVSLSVVSILGLGAAAFATFAEGEVNSRFITETVYNLNRVKILESNTSSLRPGSVYDVATYFESLLRAPMPGYNYEFIDSGLGATEPLYPMYQKGNQASYGQLIPALFDDNARHIDHRSSLTTPEGCKVDSAYLLRHITEYPDDMFKKEREEGYTRVVVRLEHYTKLRTDAQCGRHVAHDPDPNFDPMKFMWENRNAMTFADFPQDQLWRFEAKLSVNFPMIEQRGYERTPFDLRDLKKNSLWYYPEGHAFDYGINTPRPQTDLAAFKLPRQTVVEADAKLQTDYPLKKLLKPAEFEKVLAYMNGQPFPGYDASKEPGNDVLRLSDVTGNNAYTSGLKMEKIKDVTADVSSMDHFRLVGMTLKPQEPHLDKDWTGERIVPQIRFVFQMINPRDPAHVFENLFLHLKWDTADRLADEKTRAEQQAYFLKRLDEVTKARESGGGDAAVRDLIREFTQARPVHSVSFSSTLTGTWIFGNIERDNKTQELTPLKTVRQGVDYGYYSSVFDTDLLRTEIEKSEGTRKAELQKTLDALTVTTFRDPKRQDVSALRFNTVSCAQCHQMSGRDGVHMSINDGINDKVKTPTIVSEYYFNEADAQLKGDMQKWLASAAH